MSRIQDLNVNNSAVFFRDSNGDEFLKDLKEINNSDLEDVFNKVFIHNMNKEIVKQIKNSAETLSEILDED